MNAKQINYKALANTARECAQLANGVSGTMKSITIHWNLCVNQSGLLGFILENVYARRVHLASKFRDIAAKLDKLAERIEDDHAEALAMNRQFTRDNFVEKYPKTMQYNEITEEEVTEAMEINKAVDRAGLVIRAMKGADIEGVLSGIRGGMYREGMSDISKLAEMALRVEVTRAHREALEINTQVDSELAKLCRVIAGVRRTLYKQETKQELIGAACRGIIDGLRERLGVKINRVMLPELTVRAGK